MTRTVNAGVKQSYHSMESSYVVLLFALHNASLLLIAVQQMISRSLIDAGEACRSTYELKNGMLRPRHAFIKIQCQGRDISPRHKALHALFPFLFNNIPVA